MASTMWVFVIATFALGALAQTQQNCPEKNGFFPDPEQCDLYFKCKNGVAEEVLCPDGLVFDDSHTKKAKCDLPTTVECGERTFLQEAQPSDGCPRANGFFRHSDPGKCDKFVHCDDGTPNEMACPPGLIYDDSRATCAWPEESHRKDCKVSKRDALDDGFECPDGDVIGPNGRVLPHPTFPHPDDCQKFYICRNGMRPQKGSCPYGQVYNEQIFKCDEPEGVPGCEKWYDEEDKKSSKKN